MPAIADAIEQMLERVRADHTQLRAIARAEAERRFARDVVCEQISDALERLVGRSERTADTSAPALAAPPH